MPLDPNKQLDYINQVNTKMNKPAITMEQFKAKFQENNVYVKEYNICKPATEKYFAIAAVYKKYTKKRQWRDYDGVA